MGSKQAMSEPIRILYMEDDPGLALLFQRRLQQAGYVVDLAFDGEQGLAMCAAGAYDVLAVDQAMPVRDGLEVIRLLAAQGPLPPTIMVTGTGDERIAVEAMKLGARDYIVKDPEGGYLSLLPAVIEGVLHWQRLSVEREQALQALQESETRYRSLFDGVPVGLYRTEPGGRILDANPALVEILGYPDRETLLASSIIERYVHPDDCQQWQAQMERERVVRGFEVQWRRHDGEVIWVRDTAQVIADAAGRVLYCDGAVEDITARRRAEEEQRRLIQELDAFAHTVAHDLKTPLCSITGYAEMIARHHDSLPDEQLYQCLYEIEASGHKMGNIIDELLLLASVRKEEVERMPLNMGDVVAAALQRLAYTVQESQAEIILPDSWPVAVGYGPWVEEVWCNYLSNALRYGGSPPRVEMGAAPQPNGTVRFWVRDNGHGLAEADQARLFTPFTQLSQARARGHGLGLSIVRRIVEKLDGQVGVESQPGKGSVFHFDLPAGRE
jgi:PAS domain S-box-containing protein